MDHLVAEHIVHPAPSLIIHLKLLFSLFLSHAYLPDAFSFEIIHIVKDKSRNPNLLDNYRPITLNPVISKLFESVLIDFSATISSQTIFSSGIKRELTVPALFLFSGSLCNFQLTNLVIYSLT